MIVWRALRVAMGGVQAVVDRVVGWGAFGVSSLDRRNAVVSCETGQGAPLGSRVVVFCHFDRQGRIRDYTRAYVDALCGEGLAMVFVSNAGRLAPGDMAWIKARAAVVVLRHNRGYDFAAWRDAMTVSGLPGADTSFLLLANDSVYGPLHALGPVLQRMDFTVADVWGATDSWQHRFHLQSYFVAFGRRALESDAFGTFWAGVGNVQSKAWVVSRYEVGLTRALIGAGLRCQALWSYAELLGVLRRSWPSRAGEAGGNRAAADEDPVVEANAGNVERVLRASVRRVPVNPTADLWQALVEQGFPFLKRELLRDNPSYVPDVAAWAYAASAIAPADRDIILRDLQRVAKNRFP